MKIFFRTIHLYLSLLSGLVIAVVCFTGAALVFEKEIMLGLNSERHDVAVGNQRLSLHQIEQSALNEKTHIQLTSLKLYGDVTRSVEIGFLEPMVESNNMDKNTNKEKSVVRKTGYINPYTGEWLGESQGRHPFFATMFSLHRWLLADDIGKMIVGVSTVMFLFILITGIILWWPKTKAKLLRRVQPNFSSGWKRTNHDLHIVLGFYSAIFLFIFAFTGLAWSFKWFNDGIYWVTGTQIVKTETPKSVVLENQDHISSDETLTNLTNIISNYEYIVLSYPKGKDGVYSATVMPDDAVHERASDTYYFDSYTGKLLGTNLWADKNAGQKTRITFYPIHVGSIAGMPGRIIGFIVCLLGFTFPITGVILWIQRLKKKSKSSNLVMPTQQYNLLPTEA